MVFVGLRAINICDRLGSSPGLVVMGEDSCTRDCEFESQHWILDRYIYVHIIYCCIKLHWCI